LSGNPLATAAGLATLTYLKTKNPYKALDATTKEFVEKINGLARKIGVSLRINHIGSLWTPFFTAAPVTDLVSVQRADTKRYAQFFHALLSKGVYLPPSAYETAFLGTTHTRPVLAKTFSAFEYAFKQLPPG